jgi:hypothetical protein
VFDWMATRHRTTKNASLAMRHAMLTGNTYEFSPEAEGKSCSCAADRCGHPSRTSSR